MREIGRAVASQRESDHRSGAAFKMRSKLAISANAAQSIVVRLHRRFSWNETHRDNSVAVNARKLRMQASRVRHQC